MAELPENYIEQLCNTVAKAILDALGSLTIEDIDMYKLGYQKGMCDLRDSLVKEGYIYCQNDLDDVNEIIERKNNAIKENKRTQINNKAKTEKSV